MRISYHLPTLAILHLPLPLLNLFPNPLRCNLPHNPLLLNLPPPLLLKNSIPPLPLPLPRLSLPLPRLIIPFYNPAKLLHAILQSICTLSNPLLRLSPLHKALFTLSHPPPSLLIPFQPHPLTQHHPPRAYHAQRRRTLPTFPHLVPLPLLLAILLPLRLLGPLLHHLPNRAARWWPGYNKSF